MSIKYYLLYLLKYELRFKTELHEEYTVVIVLLVHALFGILNS